MTQAEITEKIKKLSSSDNIQLSALEKQMIKELIDNINKSVITSGGKVIDINKSAGKLVKESLSKFYNSSAYRNSISKILKDIDIVTDQKLTIYKDEGLEIGKKNITDAQKIVINEYLDNLNEDGLNVRFNQPLRQMIYDNIKNNVSLTELKQNITDKIQTGKAPSELGRYITNATRQAASAYTNIVDQEILNKYKTRITHFLVVGSLIDSSSPQCRQAVEKYNRKIPIDKLDEWIRFAKENGGNENLTADNLPTLLAHYGCRHSFVPYIEINKK